MKSRSEQLTVVILAFAMLTGCGSPGAPLPPSLELARAVSDLRATRKGSTVTLTWTAPASVPDVRGLSFLYRIYRRETSANTQVVAGEIPVQAGANASFIDNSFEWEKTYQYRVTVVTVIAEPSGSEQIEGDDSPEV